MLQWKAAQMSVLGAVCTVGLGVASAAEPVAGQIQRIEGSALISQGAEYKPAREGMQLRELDRIMVMEDSSALIVFADGCEHTIGDSEVLTVTAQSVCAAPSVDERISAVEKTATSQLGVGGGLAGAGVFAGVAAVAVIAGLASGTGSGDRDDRIILPPLSP